MDDETVVSIDETGTVTALKEGAATVRASILEGEVYADALVIVKGAETGPVIFEESNYEVMVGESITIPYEFDGETDEDIIWTVSDESIAAVHQRRE